MTGGRWTDAFLFTALAAAMFVIAAQTAVRYQRNACLVVGAACAVAAAVEFIALARRHHDEEAR